MQSYIYLSTWNVERCIWINWISLTNNEIKKVYNQKAGYIELSSIFMNSLSKLIEMYYEIINRIKYNRKIKK